MGRAKQSHERAPSRGSLSFRSPSSIQHFALHNSSFLSVVSLSAILAVSSLTSRRWSAQMASHSLPAPLAAFHSSATYRSQVQEILSRRESQRQTIAFSDPKKLAKIPLNVLSQEARNAFKANHADYELNAMRNRYAPAHRTWADAKLTILSFFFASGILILFHMMQHAWYLGSVQQNSHTLMQAG